MNQKEIKAIIKDIGHNRVSGSPEEKKTAEYLAKKCKEMGISAKVESFSVPVGKVEKAVLKANGKEIPCTGYLFCGSGKVEAPLVYAPVLDDVALSKLNGNIVLIHEGLKKYTYQDIVKAGAVGVITYSGDIKWKDNFIQEKELRAKTAGDEKKILCAHVNAKDAMKLAEDEPFVSIEIKQKEAAAGKSYNCIAEIPGESDKWICLSAHLDSVPGVEGVWDNLTGCIGLLAILEEAKKSAPNNYGVRACFVGSEERGLLGSKAYCEAHKKDLDNIDLDINIDMIGTHMGTLKCNCSCGSDAIGFIQGMARELGYSIPAAMGLHSSDSTSFADAGVPAISFGNSSAAGTAVIHYPYDDGSTVSMKRLNEHLNFIVMVAMRIIQSYKCPIKREIPEEIKEKLEVYTQRKRG